MVHKEETNQLLRRLESRKEIKKKEKVMIINTLINYIILNSL